MLARWQEFVGTGELLQVAGEPGRLGPRPDRQRVKGKPQQAERVTVAVESGLETLILEHAEAAAERAEASWQSLASGQALLAEAGEDLGRASRDLRRRAERAVRDWQQDVLEMVRTEGADKRSTARFLAYGVNGLSVALMVVVFAHTAGTDRRRGGHRRRLGRAGPEAAGGGLRRPGRAQPRGARRGGRWRRGSRELLEAERARYTDLLDTLALDRPDRPSSCARPRAASTTCGSAVRGTPPED